MTRSKTIHTERATMATKSKAKPRSAKKVQAVEPASHGSWSAGNLPNPGEIRYTSDMKKRIMDEVKAADKAGIPRSHVFKALAKEWSKGKRGAHRFTEHQVSSQFHVLKSRYGYDVRRAPGISTRKFTKPKTSESTASIISQLETAYLAKQRELQEALTAERRARKLAERKAARQQERLVVAKEAAALDRHKAKKLEAALIEAALN